jgi:hypothetical protein
MAIGREAPVGKRCFSQDPALRLIQPFRENRCKLRNPLAILQNDRLRTGFIGESKHFLKYSAGSHYSVRSPSDFGSGELKLLLCFEPSRGGPRFEMIAASLARK